MIASVLMPSRERPEMAEESIQSLGKGNFEILVYLDDDDSKLMQYKDMARKYPHVKLFIQPRLTYYRFHEMVNFLSEHAKGDWLFLWNDDAFMHGNWLDKLKKCDHNKLFVIKFGNKPPNMNLFPAISRKLYDTQGYYSLSPHCDSWAMDLGKSLGIDLLLEGMEVEHRRDDNTLHDDTKKHSMDAYKVTVPEHESPAVREAYEINLIKLKKHL